MAVTKSILLFYAIALLFLFSISTAQEPAAAPQPSVGGNNIEVIKDVENNAEIQKLGKFVIDGANSKNSSSPMSFEKVVSAKRWPVHSGGLRYFLNINSTKKINEVNVRGSCYAYVYENSTGRHLQTTLFKPANE